MTVFERYVGVDYSGAGEPSDHTGALRVFEATPTQAPRLVPTGSGWNWTRRELAWWLAKELQKPLRTIVGIDHAFSFPYAYFLRHGLQTWDVFLRDFCKHWPTRRGSVASLIQGSKRTGHGFDFAHKQGNVAYSTHAGLPWLRLVRRVNRALHFWPFDGWKPPAHRSVITEVYPALFSRRYQRACSPVTGRLVSSHHHDARSVCAWLQERDQYGFLPSYFNPALTPTEQSVARLEGWILGVM